MSILTATKVRQLHIGFYKYIGIRFVKVFAFNEALCASEDYCKMSERDATKIVSAVEKGCVGAAIANAHDYNVSPLWTNRDFRNIYHAICSRVLSNLDPKYVNNDYLLPRVISGEIPAEKLGGMTAREMFPSSYVEIDARIAASLNFTEEAVTHTTMYKCSRCKQSICRTYNTQFRSLDEGSGVMVICMNCHHKWHIG